MSDERYDRSADMRLLELQREALGVPKRVIGTTSYTDPDSLSDAPKDDERAFVQSGTILIAAIDAQPRKALIAGAVVTISLSVANEGDAQARDVRLTLPLPGETTYRGGALLLDGIPASDSIANDLFANGAEIGDIEAGARRTVVLKLVIEPGLNDVMLSPHITAASGAVLGLRAVRLTRGTPARPSVAERPFYESDDEEHALEPVASAAPQPTIAVLQPSEYPAPLQPKPPEQPASIPVKVPIPKTILKPVAKKPLQAPPIQPIPPTLPAPTAATIKIAAKGGAKRAEESVAPIRDAPPKNPARSASKRDADQIVKDAKKAISIPIAKAVTKRVTEEKTKSKPKLKPPAKGKPAKPAAGGARTGELRPVSELTARPKIEVVRSVDDRISFAGQGGPILAVHIDRKRLSTLTGLFSGTSLGMIAHYLVLNALAVRDPLPGDGIDGAIAAFVADQEQLLTRALISTRLGRTPSPDSVGATLPAFPPRLATHAERRAIDPPPSGEAMLFRAFQPGEVVFVQRLLSNDSAAPFMRAAQLFVGLCANDAVVADETERNRVGIALTAYAALATAEISRIFLRAKLNRSPDLFKSTDTTFDDAARTVLAALAHTLL